jgi:hypothetical protein
MGIFLLLEANIGKVMFDNGTGELWYASCVARELAPQIRAAGHSVIEVESPSPEAANTSIERYKPNVVWWVGHGSTDSITLENVALWIKAPGYNVDVLNSTIACAESCLTGAYLGKFLVEQRDCLAYLGYISEYLFPWCGSRTPCQCSGENPWGVRPDVWSAIVRSTHDATFHFVIGLARGMNVKQAFDFSLNRFDYWINYLSSIPPADEYESATIRTAIWILSSNRDIQVLYAKDVGIVVPGVSIHPLLSSAALGALTYLVALPMTGSNTASAALGALATGVSIYRYLRRRSVA